jgi:Tfp pilus assembly protein PilW
MTPPTAPTVHFATLSESQESVLKATTVRMSPLKEVSSKVAKETVLLDVLAATIRPAASPNSAKASEDKLQRQHQQQKHQTLSNCYGKVADLESNVPAEWWKTVFADDMYLQTDGDAVEDPEVTRVEIELLESDTSIKALFRKGMYGFGLLVWVCLVSGPASSS